MPGIALTGFGSEHDVSKARAAGFAEHLTSQSISNGYKRRSKTYSIWSRLRKPKSSGREWPRFPRYVL